MGSAREHQQYPLRGLVLGVLLLLPMLTFPLHTDHATFLRGGQALLSGGTLYVDFIDVKPPMIYMLYAIPAAITGADPLGVRLFDLLWQGAALAVLLAALRRSGVRSAAASMVAIAYSLMYVAVHANNTAHAEGLMSLPLALILWVLSRDARRWYLDALLGVALAVIILLKYTLGIVAPALALVVLATRTHGVRTVLAWAAWTIVALLLVLIPVLRPGFLDGWREVTAYLAVYASYPTMSFAVVRDWLKTMGVLAGDTISIAVIVAATLAIGRHLLQPSERAERQWTMWSVAVVVGLLATVVLERRFSIYQLERIYLPLSILVGMGLDAMSTSWRQTQTTAKVLLGSVAVVLLVLSPLPRYANITLLAARSLSDSTAYDTYFSERGPEAVDYHAMRFVQQYLASSVSPTGHVMLMSITAASIAPYLPSTTPSIFGDSHLYLGTGARATWHQWAADELKRSEWVVIDSSDRHPVVNLHERSSLESVRRDRLLSSLLAEQFRVDTIIGPYHLFQRRTL